MLKDTPNFYLKLIDSDSIDLQYKNATAMTTVDKWGLRYGVTTKITIKERA